MSRKTQAPNVIGDIKPYQSMITGEMITSRSHHRDHLKRHGCTEIGNEIKAAMMPGKPQEPTRQERESFKRDIAEILSRNGY